PRLWTQHQPAPELPLLPPVSPRRCLDQVHPRTYPLVYLFTRQSLNEKRLQQIESFPRRLSLGNLSREFPSTRTQEAPQRLATAYPPIRADSRHEVCYSGPEADADHLRGLGRRRSGRLQTRPS